jgi:hypothetical protein
MFMQDHKGTLQGAATAATHIHTQTSLASDDDMQGPATATHVHTKLVDNKLPTPHPPGPKKQLTMPTISQVK